MLGFIFGLLFIAVDAPTPSTLPKVPTKPKTIDSGYLADWIAFPVVDGKSLVIQRAMDLTPAPKAYPNPQDFGDDIYREWTHLTSAMNVLLISKSGKTKLLMSSEF